MTGKMEDHGSRVEASEETLITFIKLQQYLSPKIQNECISFLRNYVKEKIVADQMCEVTRYVHIKCDKDEVKESFLGFFLIVGKTTAELIEDILKYLERERWTGHKPVSLSRICQRCNYGWDSWCCSVKDQ
ncbi:uncharacterized protein LOC143225540 [Tachypleus tridentatus]|uniref:uncharacterized protein LOC143225540 n=1 Tax=Tachypleus tridentatus TaxID=6853 RepID=UPI003FD4FF6F